MNCINTNSKEYKTLLQDKKLKGIDELSVEQAIMMYQQMKGTDEFPSVDYIVSSLTRESVEQIRTSENNYNTVTNISEGLNTMAVYPVVKNTAEESIKLEKALRTEVANKLENYNIQAIYTVNRFDSFKSRMVGNILEINLAQVNKTDTIEAILFPVNNYLEESEAMVELKEALEDEAPDTLSLMVDNLDIDFHLNTPLVVVREDGSQVVFNLNQLVDVSDVNVNVKLNDDSSVSILVNDIGGYIATSSPLYGHILGYLKGTGLDAEVSMNEVFDRSNLDLKGIVINSLIEQVRGGLEVGFDGTSISKKLEAVVSSIKDSGETKLESKIDEIIYDENNKVLEYKDSSGRVFKTKAELDRSSYFEQADLSDKDVRKDVEIILDDMNLSEKSLATSENASDISLGKAIHSNSTDAKSLDEATILIHNVDEILITDNVSGDNNSSGTKKKIVTIKPADTITNFINNTRQDYENKNMLNAAKELEYQEELSKAYSKITGKPVYRNAVTSDDALLDEKVQYLRQHLNIDIQLDEELEERAVLLNSNHRLVKLNAGKPVIVINPNKLFSDTVIHEIAHLYLELQGGKENSMIREMIKKLEYTNFYEQIKNRYPSLSKDQLDMEVVATALGIEGDLIFTRNLKDLKDLQKFKRNMKDGIVTKLGMFRRRSTTEATGDYLMNLTKAILNPANVPADYTFKSGINLYSKYSLDNHPSESKQNSAIELFNQLRSDIRTDFENGKHDYIKDGEVISRSSLSGISKKLASRSSGFRAPRNKGDFDMVFNENLYDKDTFISEINKQKVLPLALAQALDSFAKGDIGRSKVFIDDSSTDNWYDVLLNENLKEAQEIKEKEIRRVNLMTGETLPSLNISFKDAILEYYDTIMTEAARRQGIRNMAPIAGNIVHKGMEDIVNGVSDILPANVFDTADDDLLNTITSIINEGKANGSVFFAEQPIYDDGLKRPGTADLIEITADGKYRVYDFKTIKNLKEKNGNDKSDYKLYVSTGYMYQLLSYGSVLESYGLEPATDAYKVMLVEIDYGEVADETADVTVNSVRVKSMEDMTKEIIDAKRNIRNEFHNGKNLDDININVSEISTLEDAANKIRQSMRLFNTKISKKLDGGLKLADYNSILDDIKKQDNSDPIDDVNKYNAIKNIAIIKSFLLNTKSQLKTLNDLNTDDSATVTSKYLQSLKYVLQLAGEVDKIKDIVSSAQMYTYDILTEAEVAELVNSIGEIKSYIDDNQKFYVAKGQMMAVNLLSQYSNLSEAVIIEKLQKEAKSEKGGFLKNKTDIRNYVYSHIGSYKAEIKQKERVYWESQFNNGILDLRTLEMLFADPGMIKSQFVQVVKQMMDTTDMYKRKQIDDFLPLVNKLNEDMKSVNPSGGTISQWGRFINKSDIFDPKTGGTVNMLDGTLIPLKVSDYYYDRRKYNNVIKNLKAEYDNMVATKASQEDLDNMLKLIEDTRIKQSKDITLKSKSKSYRQARVNPEFEKLSPQDQKALTFITEALLEDDKGVEDSKLRLGFSYGDNVFEYKLPAKRMDNMEAVSNSSLTSVYISKIKDFVRPPADEDTMGLQEGEAVDDKEETINNIITDLEGNQLLEIPLYYRRNLEDPSLQSYDIPTLLALNRRTSLDYKQGLELESDLFIIQESVNPDNNKNIVRTDTFQNMKMFNKNGTIAQRSTSNNLYKAIQSSIENRIYKRPYSGVYSKKSYIVQQAVEKLTRYSSMNSLVGNFTSALATSSQGTIFRFIEGQVGEYFDTNDWKVATSKTMMDLGNVIADTQRHVAKSKTNLLLRKFGMEANAAELVNKFVQDNFASKNLDSGTLFAVTSIAERMVTSMLMYSLLNNTKVTNADGKWLSKTGIVSTEKEAMSLDDAYEVVDGVLTLDPRVAYTNKNFIDKYTEDNETGKAATQISALMEEVYADMYGQYNQHLKSVVQRNVFGKMIMSMKGWLPRGVNRRYRGITNLGMTFEEIHQDINIDKRFYSQGKKQFQEGYYVSLMRYGYSIFKEMKGEISSITGAGSVVWNEMTDHEKANVKRSLAELSMMAMLSVLMIMLGAFARGLDDDEDDAKKERLYLMALMSYRINSELTTFVNPNSFIDMVKNPAASLNTVTSSWRLFKRMVGLEYDGEEIDWTINDRYEKGAKENELKITHDAMRLANPINQTKKFLSLFGVDTGKTIEDAYKGQMQMNN